MAAEGDELASNLQNYQVQLQQVEAALTNEPENEELLKLKHDLEEVINLTTELLKAHKSNAEASTSSKTVKAVRKWKPGDICLAPWSKDGQYYEGSVVDITEQGLVTIVFPHYKHHDFVLNTKLKPVDKKRALEVAESNKSKKQMVMAQKEYKKKKAQKKASRMKQVEEEREKEKSKWQQFNQKAGTKNVKGHVKKSIFASPDNVNGRVGVGTCGIGGKPMTEFHQQEKWRKPGGAGGSGGGGTVTNQPMHYHSYHN